MDKPKQTRVIELTESLTDSLPAGVESIVIAFDTKAEQILYVSTADIKITRTALKQVYNQLRETPNPATQSEDQFIA